MQYSLRARRIPAQREHSGWMEAAGPERKDEGHVRARREISSRGSACKRRAEGGEKPMRSVMTLMAAWALTGCVAAAQPLEKKLIEYGWDVPKPSFVAEHIREMEERPFEGLIMRVPNIGVIFRNEKWDEAEVAEEFAALESIEWDKFTDNFIVMYAKSSADWFSDADWECVLHNVGLCAKAARLGRCKGLCFDAEPYGANPWLYTEQAHAGEKTMQEYQEMVRKRGAQWMDRIEQEIEAPVIHTFFLMSIVRSLALEDDLAERARKLSQLHYGLLPAFLNGMLDAADPDTIITDGNESSYYYTKREHYLSAFHAIKQLGLAFIAPENRRKYLTQVQCAQALYVDHLFGLRTRKVTGHYLTPEERPKWFEHNVYHALSTTDEYVWLYSEKMNWWTNTDIPPGLPEAVVSAKQKLANREPLGFDVDEIIEQAEQRRQEELQAQLTKREAVIARLGQGEQPPVIDGKLEDAVWQRVEALEPFIGYLTAQEPPSVQTAGRVAYDDERLYVAVRCQEPEIGAMRIVGEARDDNVWMGESVDLFVTASAERVPYYHIIVSPANVRWDARHEDVGGDLTWNPVYESGTERGEDYWALELAIAWDEMEMTAPKAGEKLFANLCRQRTPGGNEYSTWSQCVGGFVEPGSFGTWAFE